MKGTDSTGNEAGSLTKNAEDARYSQAVYVTKVAMASNYFAYSLLSFLQA